MPDPRPEPAGVSAALEAEPTEEAEAPASRAPVLDEILSHMAGEQSAPAERGEPMPYVGLRVAHIVAHEGPIAVLRWRGTSEEVAARVAPEVERALIEQAIETSESVLVECAPGVPPVVVGVLQTRVPRELVLRAEKIRLEGEKEVTLVSGRSAIRLRSDGDLEMVATRISAASRGFFKLVGRMLRLN